MKRLIFALCATLAATACSAATGTPSPIPSAPMATGNAVAVTVQDFKITPSAIRVVGDAVSLAVTNKGPTVHNVAIRDTGGTVVVTTRDLAPGESQTISAKLAPGDYVTFCSLPGHESLGTKGTLSVSKP